MTTNAGQVICRLAVVALAVQLLGACGGTGESAGRESSPSTPSTPASGDGRPLATSDADDRVEFVTSTSSSTTTTPTTLPPTTTSTSTSTSTTTTSTTTSSSSTTIPQPTTIRCSFAADALFEPGQAVLAASAVDELERLVVATREIRDVAVEGHTDHRGSDAENLALSQARADSAAAALVAAGIDEQLISAVGLGERDATQGDPSDQQMATDRRVDVTIEANVPITTTC